MSPKHGSATAAGVVVVDWVCVLGDFGRSPRMQYHALSLSRLAPSEQPAGAVATRREVHVLALSGAPPIRELRSAGNVKLHLLPPVPGWVTRVFRPRAIGLVIKAAWQLLLLFAAALVVLPAPTGCILVQNPPAIPTLLFCWLVTAWHRRVVWIIDWHNLAYTLMSVDRRGGDRMPQTNTCPGVGIKKRAFRVSCTDADTRAVQGGPHTELPIVPAPKGAVGRLAAWYEAFFAQRAHRHLCVSRGMQTFLWQRWGVAATVLYDRPPDFFRPATGTAEKHALLVRLEHDILRDSCGALLPCYSGGAQGNGPQSMEDRAGMRGTFITEVGPQGVVALRQSRPAIVLTSTSWTPDEDFGLLLQALQLYDAAAAAVLGSNLPHLLMVVTGRGPQREYYLARMRATSFRAVTVASVWLEPEDYPRMLAAADLGVSLHTSSSGLDLPMKVVDMFGAGLPVCAADFPCISELVTPGVNGLLFSNAQQLAEQLQELLAHFPAGDGSVEGAPASRLAQLRANLTQHPLPTWEANWSEVAAQYMCCASPQAAASPTPPAGAQSMRSGKQD